MILLILTCIILGNANILLIRLKSHPNVINNANKNIENDEQNKPVLGKDYGNDLIESYNQDYKGYDEYFGDYKGYDDIFGSPEEDNETIIKPAENQLPAARSISVRRSRDQYDSSGSDILENRSEDKDVSCDDKQLENWETTPDKVLDRIWSVNYDRYSPHAKKMELHQRKDGTMNHCGKRTIMSHLNDGFISRLSTVFTGSGRAEVSFGNCNNKGKTVMFLNNEQIGKAGPDQIAVPITFSYKPRDTLHIEGIEGGIIHINSIQIHCGESQSRSVVGQDDINQEIITPSLNLKGYGRNLGVTKSPLLSPMKNQLTMRSFLENTDTTKIEQTEATILLEDPQNIYGFRKFHFGKEPKPNSCNTTVKECIKTCNDPNLAVDTTNNTCPKLCNRCMGDSWKSTQLAGGAFGSLTECFKHFSGKFRPQHLVSDNSNCSTLFVVS